ncbi:MAG: class I SAM-dependent methyltransferase [Thiobacillaceae bacterium]
MPPPPESDAEAQAVSRQLAAKIRAEIIASGGWISFARYMELALYAPGLGYYTAGSRKFGAGGDFVTAPELTPLFGRALARQAAQVLQATGGDILELGPGSGRLALDLLCALEALDSLPGRYFMLEVSADLRARQQALFEREAPKLLPGITWLDRLPHKHTGLILGNEVLDALPVHRIHWGAEGPLEQGVGLDEAGAFVWRDHPLPPGPLRDAACSLDLPPGYVSEIGLAAGGLVTSLAERLVHGVLLLLDYGFPRHEYYHPQRVQGTLMCHRRHRAHADPFDLPGLTDLTAHVDFTAVAEAGHATGLTLLGYTDQASFLINCGLLELLAGCEPGTTGYLRAAAAAHKLLQPSEMGESFKAIALGRGLEGPLLGFARGDRSARL